MITGTIIMTKNELFEELHKVENKLKDTTMKGWKREGLEEYKRDILAEIKGA